MSRAPTDLNPAQPVSAAAEGKLVVAAGPLFPLLVLLLGCVLQVLFGYSAREPLSGHAWGHDDAYISYRYVLNFLNGHGLVFNPGERVEGYSNFLYVLVLAGLASVLGRSLYPLSVGLNLLCAAAALLCFYHHIQAKWGRQNAVIAASLFALCPLVWLAVATGLETPLVLLLQIVAWMAADRAVTTRHPAAPYLLAAGMLLLILTRADGFVLGFIVLAYLTVNGRFRAALACGLAVAALSVPYFLWRHAYYGDYLPNTYYAKVAGTVTQRARFAARELMSRATSVGLLPYLMVTTASLAVAITYLPFRRRQGGEVIPFEGVAVAGWVAYWLYIGGEERFLLMIFVLGIGAFIRGLNRELKTRAGAFLLAMVLMLQLAPLGTDLRFRFTLEKYDCWKTLGVFLGQTHPGASVAVDAAGKIPYYSGLYAIDMLGLADVHVSHVKAPFTVPAHSKWDAEYVLKRRPAFIAGFLTPRLDMAWDLTRERYEAAGYRLRYLVNTGKLSARHYSLSDIVDVEELSEREIVKLTDGLYGYAVLERVKAAPR